MGMIPRLGRPPGGGHGNPLQYPCLENPMDREAWHATIHTVSKSLTRLKQLNMHAHMPSSLELTVIAEFPSCLGEVFAPVSSLCS